MVNSISRNGSRLEPTKGIPSLTLGELALPSSPLFGTDGIRGRAGDLLTSPFALHLGYWAGQVLKEKTPDGDRLVILGQDSRRSSDMLAMAIAAGLTSAGLEVWQIGLCPTPCVAHLTQTTGAMGGIMISASHNPPEDNGIKFFGAGGSKLSLAIAQRIESALRGHHSSALLTEVWGQTQHQPSLVHRYSEFLRQTLASGVDLSGMRVVLDLAWGASVQVAPAIFRSLGADVFCLHDQPDGDRINVQCGSTHLRPLQQAVRELDADLGFAFDGDADRVIAVDSLGRSVDGDYILYLWGRQLKQRQQLPNNLLVGTVMANLGFERAWQQLGGQLLRTAVGDQHVQSQMWETGAMLGGEQSGHIICHHHSFSGDGVQSALHLAALVRESGVSLAQLMEESFQPYPQILSNVRVSDRERRLHWQDCDALQGAIAKAEQALGNQGRILVRASGTEPLIRVMVESADQAMAKFWTTQLVRTVEQFLVA